MKVFRKQKYLCQWKFSRYANNKACDGRKAHDEH